MTPVKRKILPKVIISKGDKKYIKTIIAGKTYMLSGFSLPEGLVMGEEIEITYDKDSEYKSQDGTIFFNLVAKRTSNSEVMKEIKEIKETVLRIEAMVSTLINEEKSDATWANPPTERETLDEEEQKAIEGL